MVKKTFDIPVSELPFNAGRGFLGTVDENGIAHIVVFTEPVPKQSLEQMRKAIELVKQGVPGERVDMSQVQALIKEDNI